MIGLCGCDDDNIHSSDLIDSIIIDFWEDGLVLESD